MTSDDSPGCERVKGALTLAGFTARPGLDRIKEVKLTDDDD